MKAMVIYSSVSGNTKRVAQAIGSGLNMPVYSVKEAPSVADYDVLLCGFWNDKSMACTEMATYLKELTGKKIFLFGTMTEDPNSYLGDRCQENVEAIVTEQNEVLDTFLCLGKTSEKVLAYFKTLPLDDPHGFSPENIAKYNRASTHPDEVDCEAAVQAAKAALAKVQ